MSERDRCIANLYTLAQKKGIKIKYWYCGLDLSDEMIRVANERVIPGAEFIVDSADKLTYPDGHFDIVICSQSFPMQEAKRVLKPGGLYILSDTGIGGIGAWIDNHTLFKLMKSGDCHTSNRKGIERMMAGIGFAITDSRQNKGMIYTVTGKEKMPIDRSGRYITVL